MNELAECRAKNAIQKAAIEAALAEHQDGGSSQGYTDAGYGVIEHACTTCGAFGEYGEPWPCKTVRILRGVLAQ